LQRKHIHSSIVERIPAKQEFFQFIDILNHNLFYKKKEMAYMTQEGYDKMVAQLRHMETIDRPAASAAIAEARDKGDLSENSEYDAAKEAQAMLETKINQLKAAIAEAKIIDASMLRGDVVQILSTVEMKNVKNNMVMKYTIVSESEANLREGKISSTTPIAQGLLGKKVGDVVDVKIPQGNIQLEILSISVG
jgi:transcription elongation factor GreA